MREWSWNALLDLPADEAQAETETVPMPGSCPCSCLRSMVHALDAETMEQALLEAQAALGAVSGRVILSVYRRKGTEARLELLATGHDPVSAAARARADVVSSSVLEAVLEDGKVRCIMVEQGDVSAAAVAALLDHGQTSGLLLAEFIREQAGVGKPAAVCMECVAAVLSVAVVRAAASKREADLLELSRYHSVAELSAQVAHDLNNIMQGVLGNVEMARMELPEGNPIQQSLGAVEDSAARASLLARKLLNFARDSAKGSQTCNAVKAVSDAVDLAGTLYLKGARVKGDLPATPVPVRMTDNELENALILLIKSSVLGLSPVTGVEVSLADEPGRALVTISMRIQGVSREIGDEDRTEASSLASAARAVVTGRRGLLQVSSLPGSIAILLSVERDVAEEPGSGTPSAQPPHESGLRGVHVLVIGKPSVVPVLLGAAGCETATALNWEEGRQRAVEFKARVIVASVGSSSELDAAADGRARLGLPVIVVSQQGVACPPEKTSLIDAVLGQPLDLGELRRALARVLE